MASDPEYGTRDACVKCELDIEYVGTTPGEGTHAPTGLGWWDRGGNYACPDRIGGFHAPALDCGHAPQPSFYNGPVTVDGRQVDATGRVMFPGYATTPDGRRICPDCADREQRDEMRTARRLSAYLASDGKSVTTWTGGKLGAVTRCTRNDRQTFVRVVDVHGQHWAGIGPAESGTYVNLRRVKG